MPSTQLRAHWVENRHNIMGTQEVSNSGNPWVFPQLQWYVVKPTALWVCSIIIMAKISSIGTADCRSLVTSTRKVLPRSHEPIRFACDDVTTNLIG